MSETAAVDADSRPTLNPGDVVDDRYEVVALIARGIGAWVYEARHVQLQQAVALEVLHARTKGRCEFEQRFARALRRAEAIDHPNVVKIHDFGFCGTQRAPYIATELLAGIDLLEASAGDGLAPRRFLPRFAESLAALAEAHGAGLVHTALDPSNFFLVDAGTERERLIVLDLGAASVSLLGERALAVAPRYTPPEVLCEGRAVAASDVYQLGLTLAATLMGCPVVESDDPATAFEVHCRGALQIPRALAESPLGELLRAALAVDPLERMADAGRLRDALVAIDPDHVPVLGPEALADRIMLSAPIELTARARAAIAGDSLPAHVAVYERDADASGAAEDPASGDANAGTDPDAAGDRGLEIPPVAADPSGIHSLAASGDQRGILASMESIDQLEPEAAATSGQRASLIVAAVVITALLAVALLLVLESGTGGSTGNEAPASEPAPERDPERDPRDEKP